MVCAVSTCFACADCSSVSASIIITSFWSSWICGGVVYCCVTWVGFGDESGELSGSMSAHGPWKSSASWKICAISWGKLKFTACWFRSCGQQWKINWNYTRKHLQKVFWFFFGEGTIEYATRGSEMKFGSGIFAGGRSGDEIGDSAGKNDMNSFSISPRRRSFGFITGWALQDNLLLNFIGFCFNLRTLGRALESFVSLFEDVTGAQTCTGCGSGRTGFRVTGRFVLSFSTLVKPTEPRSKLPSGFVEEIEDSQESGRFSGELGSDGNFGVFFRKTGVSSYSSPDIALFLTTTGEEKVAVISSDLASVQTLCLRAFSCSRREAACGVTFDLCILNKNWCL